MTSPVILRQNILGELREGVGKVEFEIPFEFTLKGGMDTDENVFMKTKEYAQTIIADLYKDLPNNVFSISHSAKTFHCSVTDEDGVEATTYRYSIIVEMYVTDDMVKECYHRIMMYS